MRSFLQFVGSLAVGHSVPHTLTGLAIGAMAVVAFVVAGMMKAN